jgi:hypothetical protein
LSGGAPPDVTPLFGEDIPIFYTLAHLHHRRLSAIVYATTFTSIIFVIYQLPALIAAAIVTIRHHHHYRPHRRYHRHHSIFITTIIAIISLHHFCVILVAPLGALLSILPLPLALLSS